MSDLRLAAHEILREVTGATRVTRLCPHCGGADHGRPRLVGSDLRASIAYAGGLVAVAWGAGDVGVDVERVTDPPRRLERLGVPDLAAWTRIEALAKAAGTGLRDWPDVVLPDLPTRRLELPEGYVGAVAGAAQVRLAGPAAPSS